MYYIEVFRPENKKIKEIPYNTELLFSSPSGFIYFTDNESKSVFMYKLDSNTDEVILKKKFQEWILVQLLK